MPNRVTLDSTLEKQIEDLTLESNCITESKVTLDCLKPVPTDPVQDESHDYCRYNDKSSNCKLDTNSSSGAKVNNNFQGGNNWHHQNMLYTSASLPIKADTSFDEYAEIDLDDPDQPTDYSQKYMEHMDTSEDYELLDIVKVYHTEGTPLTFSTASSLLDLRESGPEAYERKLSKVIIPASIQEPDFREKANQKEVKKNETTSKKTDGEGVTTKLVTFGEEVNYIEETPLMYSRCSSLGSISSFEQPSLHDDGSSVVSEFSCRASEVVSPSDLPDSPSQTMPTSPRRIIKQQPTFEFGSLFNQRIMEDSAPEDTLKVYFEEDTPANLSANGSVLSLLIVDKETKTEEQMEDVEKLVLCIETKNALAPVEDEQSGIPKMCISDVTEESSLPLPSDLQLVEDTQITVNCMNNLVIESNDTLSSLDEAVVLSEPEEFSPSSKEISCRAGEDVGSGSKNHVLTTTNPHSGLKKPGSSPVKRSTLSGDAIGQPTSDLDERQTPKSSVPKTREQNRPALQHTQSPGSNSQVKPSSHLDGTLVVSSQNSPHNLDSDSEKSETHKHSFIKKCKPTKKVAQESMSANIQIVESTDEMLSHQSALLQECIDLGRPKKKAPQEVSKSTNKPSNEELLSYQSTLLQDCIQLGRPKKKAPEENLSGERLICTVKTEPSNELSPSQSALLEECIQLGRPKKMESQETSSFYRSTGKTNSESTDDLSPYHRSLLQECIHLGRPKKKEVQPEAISSCTVVRNSEPVNELSPHQNALLQNCIELGRPKKKTPRDASSGCSSITKSNAEPTDDLSPYHRSLLQDCIDLGRPKKKVSKDTLPSGCRSASTSSVEPKGDLSSYHRLLLQECIELGRPKKKEMQQQVVSNSTSGRSVKPANEAKHALLQECIEMGRPKKKEMQQQVVSNSTNGRSVKPANEAKLSQHALLQECIEMGRPKKKTSRDVSSVCKSSNALNIEPADLSPYHHSLLQECISLGRPKKKEAHQEASSSSTLGQNGELTKELSSQQNAILQDCIELGRPKKKLSREGLSGRRSTATLGAEKIDELSSHQRVLLQDCIQLGRPKRRGPCRIPIPNQRRTRADGQDNEDD